MFFIFKHHFCMPNILKHKEEESPYYVWHNNNI